MNYQEAINHYLKDHKQSLPPEEIKKLAAFFQDQEKTVFDQMSHQNPQEISEAQQSAREVTLQDLTEYLAGLTTE